MANRPTSGNHNFYQPDLTVLCGHTHGHGETEILTNLHIKTGGAEYDVLPILQDVIKNQ